MKKTFKLSFLLCLLFGINTAKAQINVGTSTTGTPTLVKAISGTVVGNVGIGVTSPTEKLQVAGNINATGNITTVSGNVSASTITATNAIPAGTNSNQVATTAFVNTATSSKENILSFSAPLVRNSNAISINNASSTANGVLTSTDWNRFNNKQNTLTLTTNGTTGPATLSGSTLNIPKYTVGGGTQTLQDVTTMGAATTNYMEINYSSSFEESDFSYYPDNPAYNGLTVNNYSTGINSGFMVGTGIKAIGRIGGNFIGGIDEYGGIGISASATYGNGIEAYSNNGIGVKAVSANGTGLLAYSENNGVAIKANMEDNAGKGIVISSDDYSTGNPLEITKNNVAKLVVNQQGEITATKFKTPNGTANQFLMADGTTSTGATASTIYNTDGSLSSARTVAMGANAISFNGTGNYMINAGNVGIGTANPVSKFHVDGDINATGLTRKIGFSVNDMHPQTGRARYGLTQLSNYSVTGETNFTRPGVALSGYFGLSFFTGDSEAMRISDWGNVGIGTTTPDEKLAVNGKIHAKEVRVDLLGWPDFVFKKEYNLPTLQEVETHIKDKGHLKDIPSEKEVLQNGANLGEMNSKLLQKVEELTLYLIQQNKDIELLKAQVNALKAK